MRNSVLETLLPVVIIITFLHPLDGIQRVCEENNALYYYESRCKGKVDKGISYRTCDSVSGLYTVDEARLFCCHWQWCCATCVQMIAQLRQNRHDKMKAVESRTRILESIIRPQLGGDQVPVVSVGDVASALTVQ